MLVIFYYSLYFLTNFEFKFTNYTVTSNFDGRGNQVKPALGESWVSIPNSRLILSYNPSNDTRVAELVKSPCMVCYYVLNLTESFLIIL